MLAQQLLLAQQQRQLAASPGPRPLGEYDTDVPHVDRQTILQQREAIQAMPHVPDDNNTTNKTPVRHSSTRRERGDGSNAAVHQHLDAHFQVERLQEERNERLARRQESAQKRMTERFRADERHRTDERPRHQSPAVHTATAATQRRESNTAGAAAAVSSSSLSQ